VEVEDIKKIRKGGLVIVKMNNLEQKKELMSEKRKVSERGIKIDDDLTWEERKNEMEDRRNSETREGKKKESMDKIWEGINRRKMMEMI